MVKRQEQGTISGLIVPRFCRFARVLRDVGSGQPCSQCSARQGWSPCLKPLISCGVMGGAQPVAGLLVVLGRIGHRGWVDPSISQLPRRVQPFFSAIVLRLPESESVRPGLAGQQPFIPFDATQVRMRALHHHAGLQADGSALPWRQQGSLTLARRRSPARETSRPGSPSCPAARR